MLRSTSRPVYRLPPELISHIARFVPGEYDDYTSSLIPLTHVCRFWRGSIISTPEIWALIRHDRINLAKLSLERAKAAPLTICLNLYELRDKREFLDLLLPHIKKIVSLTCHELSEADQLTRLLNFPKSMPNLRSLYLTEPVLVNPNQSVDSFDLNPTHTALTELTLCGFPLVPSILGFTTLTEFVLLDRDFQLHIGVLLNFLEKNHSLKRATLMTRIAEPSPGHSHRKTPIGNGLEHLSISCNETANIRALVSSIALQRGGALEILPFGSGARLADMISGISTNHLLNLSSPVFMEYEPFPRKIRLAGPNGSFLYKCTSTKEAPLGEFPLLPLANIRKLCLKCHGSEIVEPFRLLLFPSLEVLAVSGSSGASLLSPVLPDRATSPLKTLALLDCAITEDFMMQLTQIALAHGNTSAPLHRVVIIDPEGEFPPAASVERLRECVPVVEVAEGNQFPMDLF